MADEASDKTVLVVDDSRFFRSLLAYAFDEEGYRCISAGSGEEALQILGRELPDVHLLVTDLAMPGMNGFALIEKLRTMAVGKELPVVVASQYALNALERELLKGYGVHAVLPKSAPIERLLWEARTVLRPAERERRTSPRVPVTLPVTVRTPNATFIASTFNASDDGFFLAIPEGEPPRVGTDVEVKIWIPAEERIFVLRGTVAWLNECGPKLQRSLPPGFGVKLTEASTVERAAIQRYLSSV